MKGLIIFISSCVVCLFCIEETNDNILFSDARNIMILNTATGNTTVIATGYSWVLYVDYYYAKSLIFWSDETAGTISRITFPSEAKTEAEVIIRAGSPLGIAVDTIHDHVYWADLGSGRISRSDLDGTNTIVILYNIDSVRDIELDINNGWVFFSGHVIEKCRLDGSNRQTVINDINLSENFAIDLVENRIYWTDIDKQSVGSSYLNGSDVMQISSGYGLMGIDTTRTYIYYTTAWTPGHLYRINKNGEYTTRISVYTTSNYMMSVKIYKSGGECDTDKFIQNQEKRSVGYILDEKIDHAYSDGTLKGAWYRVKSANGDVMATKPPGVLHCGTYKPIWLNGSLPTLRFDIVSSEACMQTDNDVCEESFNITIKNCGSYYVYNLQNTTANSAYCFGFGPVRCPSGLSSESGFYPGCSSSFPNETASPMVKAELINGKKYQIPNIEPSPSLISVFICRLDVSDDNYWYDIYWYINGEMVIFFKNIRFMDINTTVLKDEHWIGKYRMNMEVKCSVRIRFTVDSIPSPFYESDTFLAGLYPEKYEYSVVEGEPINISFTSTVPVACFTSNQELRSKRCNQIFYVFQPNYQKDTVTCLNNIAKRDIVFNTEFCGIQFGSIDWNKKRNLQVYGFSDGLYNHQDRSTNIRLSTSATTPENRMWFNTTVPDIKVTVLDKDSILTSRLCQSYNDPHIITFDGKQYDYMEVGEFVMYRNNRGPYWVHALFTNCGFGWQGSSCNCGIAVRSRKSLFVLRTCDKISRSNKYLLDQPLVEVQSCDYSDLSIDHNGNNYKITLPIGTEIRFSVDTYTKFITRISIKPSIYDINEAKGLCGVPSLTRDTSDDYTHRELGTPSDERSFADSWRINSTTMLNEQLFIAEPSFLTEEITIGIGNSVDVSNSAQKHYCACEKQAKPTDDIKLFYTVQCNLTESTEQCSATSQSPIGTYNNVINAFPTTCSPSYRGKRSPHRIVRRSVSDSDDVVDVKTLEYDNDVTVTEIVVPSFRDGWTEELANRTCYERIHQAIPTDLFGDMTGLSDTDYIASCILDIKLTANTQFLKDTVGAMQTYTIMEASRNETLTINKTENGSQTILEYITSLLCPSNCSGNGNCTLGVCSCSKGFIGDDCSIDVSTPPINISLPTDGLCGTRSRACKRTNIYGTFPSTNVWCKRRHFQLLNDTKTYTSNAEVIKAEYRNAFMVSIDLQSSRRKRSTPDTIMADGYEISLSNDNVNYGEPTTIIIYDEECMACNSTNVVCVVLESCPYFTTTTIDTTTQRLTTAVGSTTLEQTTKTSATVAADIYTTTKATTTTETELKTTSAPILTPTAVMLSTPSMTSTTTKDIRLLTTESLTSNMTISDTTSMTQTLKEITSYTSDATTTSAGSTTEEQTTTISATIADAISTEKAKITKTETTANVMITTTKLHVQLTTETIFETTSVSRLTPTTTTENMLSIPTKTKTTDSHTTTTESLTSKMAIVETTSTAEMSKEITSETMSSTTNKGTTEMKRSLSETDQVTSYMIPAVIGGCIGFILIISIAVIACRKVMTEQPRTDTRKQLDEHVQTFDGWNFYAGKPGAFTNEAYTNSSPSFRHAPRLNTRLTSSNGRFVGDNNKSFFELYSQQ